MNSSPYQKYLDNVSNELQFGKKRGEFKKAKHFNFDGNGNAGIGKVTNLMDRSKDESLFESLSSLSNVTGKTAKYHEKPGSHPHFLNIKMNNTVEYHYITTMFIDIKNSTALFRKYDPITVANIEMTIQRAAIHTCWYFDGYIHRFNGDGLMIYFGGRNISVSTSVNNALNAASFFSYFVKNDLKNLFFEQGVENIYTRIGIDTGEDEDVLWHLAGMGDCSEITTCSLHTSLASKLQGNASNNGIMIGDNVKDNSNCTSDLFSIKWNGKEGKEERYIFQIPEENFNYTQWQFNWEKHLKNHPLVKTDTDGNLYIAGATVGAPLILPSKKNIDYLKEQIHGYRPSIF
jgi:adenylate cyclase